jgi:hypothetical protein
LMGRRGSREVETEALSHYSGRRTVIKQHVYIQLSGGTLVKGSHVES